MVWVQGDGSDPTASGRNLALMAFDTDDGRGERPILAERGSYIKPLLIAGGQRVLFTRRQTSAADIGVYVVGWDGSGLRKLADGAALAVWQEPGSGRDWLYLGTQNSDASPGDFKLVSRFPVDQPTAREVVWNKTAVSGDTFQVSADGKLAGGLFPWPKAGVATLPNGDLRLFGDGCWTAMRDAGVPLVWYFDGSHRNVTMVDPEADRRWTVPLNQAPGFAGAEVYHPRWANHPRFVAISGPYNQGGANQVRTGGAQTEIYLGRFSRDYSTVEAWARVTRNGGGDSYPDVWIDRTSTPHPIELVRSAPKTVPAQGTERAVVEARLVTSAASSDAAFDCAVSQRARRQRLRNRQSRRRQVFGIAHRRRAVGDQGRCRARRGAPAHGGLGRAADRRTLRRPSGARRGAAHRRAGSAGHADVLRRHGEA